MSEPVTYALRFRGEAVELSRGRFWAECRAQGCVFLRATGPDSLSSRFDGFGGFEALCRRNFELHEDGSLVEAGEVSFGAGDAITFRAHGGLRESLDPRLRHGTALCEVTGGRGRLAGAHGSIASQFLLSDSGDLTDHHLGLLFVERQA